MAQKASGPGESTLIYTSKMNPMLGRNFELLEPLFSNLGPNELLGLKWPGGRRGRGAGYPAG